MVSCSLQVLKTVSAQAGLEDFHAPCEEVLV
jgi:hypothetical protein